MKRLPACLFYLWLSVVSVAAGKKPNVLLITADDLGIQLSCYGDPIAQTPNIDALAARGTRFSNAYCNSPVCIPARATFATGRYIHEIGYWDNADPYEGSVPSWHHRLRDAGHEVVSIGKLHFRSGEDDIGVLGVGSHDTQRYQAEDGTLFLEYLAEVIGQLPASG